MKKIEISAVCRKMYFSSKNDTNLAIKKYLRRIFKKTLNTALPTITVLQLMLEVIHFGELNPSKTVCRSFLHVLINGSN